MRNLLLYPEFLGWGMVAVQGQTSHKTAMMVHVECHAALYMCPSNVYKSLGIASRRQGEENLR